MENEGSGGSGSPSPVAPAPLRASSDEARAVGAWRSWLGALASDAEAALAAAMTYGALGAEARDAWLDALERDRGSVDVPRVALYAPLLAVEEEETRRARIARDMGAAPVDAARASHLGGEPPAPAKAPLTTALRGRASGGDVVCAVAVPLYLEFVELLVCRYHPDRGVASAHHEPFRHSSHLAAAVASAVAEPIDLAAVPLGEVIDELAHAIVADRREGRPPPEPLARFSHLFGPDRETSWPAA